MKHFLHISDYNESELREILNLAKDLKEKFHSNEDYNPFKNKSGLVREKLLKIYQDYLVGIMIS